MNKADIGSNAGIIVFYENEKNVEIDLKDKFSEYYF
jgi:hypothetical protein